MFYHVVEPLHCYIYLFNTYPRVDLLEDRLHALIECVIDALFFRWVHQCIRTEFRLDGLLPRVSLLILNGELLFRSNVSGPIVVGLAGPASAGSVCSACYAGPAGPGLF